LLEDEDPVTFSRGRLLRHGRRRDETAAVSLGAPTTAAAAGLGAATKLTTPGLLGKLGVLVGGAGLGAAGGIAGIVLGSRRLFAQARDDRERRGLRLYVIVGILLTLAATAAMVSTGNPWVMGVIVLAFYCGIVGLIFAWLPRVTARRRAAELAADPTAARRHQRERRFQIFGAVMGLLVGAVLVIWAILQQSGR
jgi:Ca2+/Na+ antiporter